MDRTQDIVIRRFEKGDASDVSRLVIDNLMLVNIGDLGEAATKAMVRFYTPQLLLEYAERGEMSVATEKSSIVGTATLEDNRVRNVFVRVDQQKKGIGSILMRHIEGTAGRQGQTELYLQAHGAAVGFYRNLGYEYVEAKEEQIGGTPVRMVVMKKGILAV